MACDSFRAEPDQREELSQIHKTLRLLPFSGSEYLAAILPIQQLLESLVDCLRQSELLKVGGQL